MKMKINDKVMCIDEDLEGVITKILGSQIFVLTSDGFELPFAKNQLIVLDNKQNLLKQSQVSDEIIKHKHLSAKKPVSRKMSKKEVFTREVDLHIEKLVDHHKGLSNYDILEIQIRVAQKSIEQAIREKTPKLVLIHGVGEGILKNELEFLYRKYEFIKVQEANFQKYGFGATELYFEQKSRLIE